jgi:uncharacterized membrane protein
MFDMIFGKLSNSQKGFLALVVGLILVLGALGKLGFFQTFLNFIMIFVGLYLLVQGFQATNLLNKLKNIKK